MPDSVPVIDNTTRANENPLSNGGNWIAYGGDSALQLTGNAIVGTGAGDNGRVWNAATFGPACEMAVTFATVGSTIDRAVYLTLRGTNLQGSVTLIIVIIYPFGSSSNGNNPTVFCDTYVNGSKVSSPIAATTITGMGAGSEIAADAFGNNVAVWHKPSGGSWAQVASGTQSDVTGAGNVAVEIQGTVITLTNVKAGTVTVPVNTVAPVVTGTPTVGQTLSVTTGTWV